MESPLRFLFALAAACTIAACAADNATSPLTSSDAAAALASAPITFDQLNTSFVGSSRPDDGFVPMGTGDRREHHFGPAWG
ncbi:MAG: hypothetical protein ACJ78M_14725, partial [Gemmatimonadaceae bacterium]